MAKGQVSANSLIESIKGLREAYAPWDFGAEARGFRAGTVVFTNAIVHTDGACVASRPFGGVPKGWALAYLYPRDVQALLAGMAMIYPDADDPYTIGWRRCIDAVATVSGVQLRAAGYPLFDTIHIRYVDPRVRGLLSVAGRGGPYWRGWRAALEALRLGCRGLPEDRRPEYTTQGPETARESLYRSISAVAHARRPADREELFGYQRALLIAAIFLGTRHPPVGEQEALFAGVPAAQGVVGGAHRRREAAAPHALPSPARAGEGPRLARRRERPAVQEAPHGRR